MHSQRSTTLILLTLLLALALAGCGPASTPASPTAEAGVEEAFSITATDALGNEVTLDAKPTRIVSLTLGTDEILLDLVGPERLIAVTYLASDPASSNIADHPELGQIPNAVDTSPEPIIALEPDLVLVASFTDPAVIDQLRGAGLPVFAIGSFTSIAAMQENILLLGELVGEAGRAQEMVEAMNDRLATVEAIVSQAEGEPPTVLYLANDGWVGGSATTVDDIIMRAGGVNAAAQAGLVDWNQVGEEAIIEMNPDVVILSTYVTDDEFLTNPVFANLSAIQNDRAIAISDAHMSATSQYIVLGVEDVSAFLYPDLFPSE
jgi:iron complex transport system substrate-binding protein